MNRDLSDHDCMVVSTAIVTAFESTEMETTSLGSFILHVNELIENFNPELNHVGLLLVNEETADVSSLTFSFMNISHESYSKIIINLLSKHRVNNNSITVFEGLMNRYGIKEILNDFLEKEGAKTDIRGLLEVYNNVPRQ